jgi:hypothetical protein
MGEHYARLRATKHILKAEANFVDSFKPFIACPSYN